MDQSIWLQVISWIAVVVLSSSFWFQIWRIHTHREVRDLSITYFILLKAGYAVLSVLAYSKGTWIFFVKQVATLVPSLIIICQIIYHRGDRWHDTERPICRKCTEEIDENWGFCPFCGTTTESF